jgi:hypothetical protein
MGMVAHPCERATNSGELLGYWKIYGRDASPWLRSTLLVVPSMTFSVVAIFLATSVGNVAVPGAG